MKRFSKEEKSWMIYDWGNSAYSIVISTAVFPLYYKVSATNAGLSGPESTAFLSYTISIATFILAILAPILGTIADYQGNKKRFFRFFVFLGILSTIFLALIPSEQWLLLLILYTITVIGSSGSNVFYDAFLVDVTTNERMDQISARGFSLGYIGSTIPFIFSITIIVLAQTGSIPVSVTLASQLAFLITALWWGIFTIPILKNVIQRHFIKHEPNRVLSSFKRLGNTLKESKQHKGLFLFLLAYFFYIDGVGTIITMSTAYGTDLGISSTNLLIILFVTQIVAAPFALIYGRLAERFSTKKLLYVGIMVYIIVCIYAFFMDTTLDLWVLAMLVATSQGGIQALSRSFFGKIIPKERANEFFGFYNIFGRFASISGPVLVGITAQLTHNSSYGVFSLIILFILGLVILVQVPDPQAPGSSDHSKTI